MSKRQLQEANNRLRKSLVGAIAKCVKPWVEK